ncbi:MAG TPA: ABC transporter permease [Pirellulales bacterium]
MRLIDLVVQNLWQRRARSLLTCLGIALAVATTLALVGFSSGLERSTVEAYEGREIDVIIARSGVTQRLTSSLDEHIGEIVRQIQGVRAVNPSQTDMVSFGEGSLVGVPVHGWPAAGFAMQTLSIASGRRLQPKDHDCVMLGQSLAATLNKTVGDEIEIELHKFRVVGIYAGLNVYDNMTAVTLLPDLQALMDRPGQVTEFQLTLDKQVARDKYAVDNIRKQIESLHDEQGRRLGLAAMPARQFVEGSTEAGLARGMAWGTSILALLIGSFGLLNTMLMSVLERVQEIGILKALGWRTIGIAKMILLEALTLSLLGAIIGAAAGIVLMRVLSTTSLLGGLLEPNLSPTTIAAGVAMALCIGALGGLYPAIRAAKLSVVEALRYE